MLKTATAGPCAIEDKKQRETKITRIIAALAYDIRCDWFDGTKSRVRLMIKLCASIDKEGWASQLRGNMGEIIEDGRWMRDVWAGPYYATNQKDLDDDVLYEKYKGYFEALEICFTPNKTKEAAEEAD